MIESDGLLRIEGEFTVRAQQIDGLFRVGVAISSVRWVSQIGAAVFDQPSRDGYAWTTMHLTGPVNNPHEDLTGRLAASAEQAVAHKAKEGTDAVLDTASSLLDLLKAHCRPASGSRPGSLDLEVHSLAGRPRLFQAICKGSANLPWS